jgi:hypothetical protein
MVWRDGLNHRRFAGPLFTTADPGSRSAKRLLARLSRRTMQVEQKSAR